MSFFLGSRAARVQPAPQRNAPAQPTTNNHSNRHQHRHQHHHSNNHQQMQIHENSDNTSHSYNSNNNGNTKQQQQQLFHQAASQNAPSPAPALAHKKKVTGSSNNSCNKKKSHMASNRMETPSQRQVTQGPQSLLSGQEPQNARASRQNRGGPSTTAISCAICFEFRGFPWFLMCCFVVFFRSALQHPGS